MHLDARTEGTGSVSYFNTRIIKVCPPIDRPPKGIIPVGPGTIPIDLNDVFPVIRT